MEVKAEIVDVTRDLQGRFRLTFATQEDIRQPVEELAGREIRLTAKIWRNKRSNDANAYFHVLKDKIASRLNISHIEAHNQLIADYGQPDYEVGHMILKDSVDWRRLEWVHLAPTPRTQILDNGELYRVCRVMRGSHTYDTAEMARLIDGTVYEAKELGIETLPPDELEAMKRAWKASFANEKNATSAEEQEKSCITASMEATEILPTQTA